MCNEAHLRLSFHHAYRPNMLFPILNADMSMSYRTPPSAILRDTTAVIPLQRGVQNTSFDQKRNTPKGDCGGGSHRPRVLVYDTEKEEEKKNESVRAEASRRAA